jgi:CheY-like chemotaxis protein
MMSSNVLKIMVVDDSKLARRMVTRVIQQHFPDWEIIEAVNADDAMEKSWGEVLHRITLDMNMPGQDGLSFAPALREIHPEAKIALVTANIQFLVQKRAAELGLVFMPKPVSSEQLLDFLYD